MALSPTERATIEKRSLGPFPLVGAARRAAGTRGGRVKPFQDYPDSDEVTIRRRLDGDLKSTTTTWASGSRRCQGSKRRQTVEEAMRTARSAAKKLGMAAPSSDGK